MNNQPVWDDGHWRDLPALQHDARADICVVGLGGSGLAAVKELRALGKSVIGIDAGAIAGGAAGRNGGFLLAGPADFHHDAVAAHGRERANRLYQLTLAELDRMTAETPEAIRRTGSLRIAADDTEYADCLKQFEIMRMDHRPAELYEGPEGRGLLIPTDGVFNPLMRCRALARQVMDAGAVLYEKSPALEIGADGVRTPNSFIHCAQILVAVDGKLEQLVPELAGRVRSARLQMLATAALGEIRFTRPVYRRWGYDYWQQLPDGRIALGGLRDSQMAAEWTDHAKPSEAIQDGLDKLLREVLRVSVPVTHRWAAIVGYTENGLPIAERVRENVWAIGGYNGTGNIVGAICGRGIARQMVHDESDLLDWRAA